MSRLTPRTVGRRRYPERHEQIARALRRYNALAQPALLLRREVVLAAGGYRFSVDHTTEDYELWCRLAARGARLANLPVPLTQYRLHPAGTKSHRLRSLLRGTLAVKEMYFAGERDPRAWLRALGERLLLLLPPWLVLRLFRATQLAEHGA